MSIRGEPIPFRAYIPKEEVIRYRKVALFYFQSDFRRQKLKRDNLQLGYLSGPEGWWQDDLQGLQAEQQEHAQLQVLQYFISGQ